MAREHDIARAAPRGAVEVDGSRGASFEQRLHQAVHAIASDRRQLRAFQAGPAAFLRRYQLDARHPQARLAIGMLEQLLAAGAREADPSGEARASSGVVIAPSSIHGEGVFAHEGLGGGTVVCDVGVGDQVSHTASKVNQSTSPNTEMVHESGRLVVKTLKPVEPGDELVASYPLVGDDVKAQLPPPRSG